MSFLGDLGSLLLGVAYELRVPLAIAGVAAAVVLLVIARRRGWAGVARRHPTASAVLLAGALLVAVPLGWYLVSPVFLRTEVNEPPPVVAVVSPGPSPTPASPSIPVTAAPATAAPGSWTPTTAAATPSPARLGAFTGTDDFHFGRGTVTLLETGPGEWTLRFDDFSVRNGPDLFVYLSPDPDGRAHGAIEVARLKATDGSFNQRVPAGTDVSEVRSVLIWCKQFSHLFAVAPLDG